MKNILNIIASMLAFAVNIIISFILSPIIVNSLGTEAYGYVTLTNNMAYYFSLIGLTVNSMGLRFITVSAHEKKMSETQMYYTTVLLFNCILGGIIFGCGILFAWNMNAIFNVSPVLATDVQMAFVLSFFAGALSIIMPIFNSGVYIKDRIDLLYISTIVACITRLVVTVLLFSLLPIKIYYVAISSIFSSLVTGIIMAIYTKISIPTIKVRLHYFDISKLLEIVKSGIWILLENVSTILITGLGLVYANIFIGEQKMGLFSIAQTIPVQFQTLVTYVVQTFVPQLLYFYSQNMHDELQKKCSLVQKISGYIVLIPICGIIAFGKDFYKLWISSRTIEEIEIIQKLSVIVIIPYLLVGYTQAMNQLNIIYNKVKTPTIISIVSGLAGALLTMTLGVMGKLDVYQIAIISSVVFIVKELLAKMLYTIRITHMPWKPFVKNILVAGIYAIVLTCAYVCIQEKLNVDTWTEFIATIAACGFLGYVVPVIDLFHSGLFIRKKVC